MRASKSTLRGGIIMLVACLLILPSQADGQGRRCALRYVEQGPVSHIFPYSPLGTIEDRRVWDLLYEPLARMTTRETVHSELLDLDTAREEQEGRVWVFPIRETRWHNGDPLKGEDIVRTFNELKRLHAEGLTAWTQEIWRLEVMTAMSVSGNELRVEYGRPMKRDAASATLDNFFVIPWDQHPTLTSIHEGRLNDFAANDHAPRRGVIGNGRWEPASRTGMISSVGEIRLIASESFPSGESPIDEIMSYSQPIGSERAQMFRDGTANVVLELTREHVQQFENSIPGAQRITHDKNTFTSVIMSTRHSGLRDHRVREALIFALDRRSILQAYNGGHGDISDAPYPPDTRCYNPAVHGRVRNYSPDRAKELLREAGYEFDKREGIWKHQDGTRLSNLEFILPSTLQGAEDQRIAKNILDSWKESIQLEIRLVEIPPDQVNMRLESGSYDFYMETRTASPAWELSRLLLPDVPGSRRNEHFHCSPDVAGLLRKYRDNLGRDDQFQDETARGMYQAIAEASDRIYLWSLSRVGIFQSDEIEFHKFGTTVFQNPGLWRCR